MALRRITTSIDGTIPVQALLYDDEEIRGSQEGAGIYDGLQKAQQHQAGTVHLSTHRLFYIDARNAYNHSFALDLAHIIQTDYYAGLFKSSPKITLHLSGSSNIGSGQAIGDSADRNGFEIWECEVCAYRNPPGLSPAAARVCALCGVPRSSVSPSATSQPQWSTSLPSSSVSTPPPASISLDSVACPACTFLNHPSLPTCEICSTELPRTAKRPSMKSAPSSRPASPDLDGGDGATARMIKLSFRKGGDKPFYTILKRCLKSKAWEAAGIGARTLLPSKSTESEQRHTAGISGILQTVESSAQGRETGMQSALQDLEALMVKAKDMVRLAAELNEKLTAAPTLEGSASPPPQHTDSQTPPSSPPPALFSSIAEPEEATFIRSSLSQLGLQMANAPVTLDMIKDERKWIEELARELAGVLQGLQNSRDGQPGGGIMRDRGIIALDEVWGGWNRARGVALIPPQTLLQVIPYISLYTAPPIQTRTLASGLRVLHTPPYTHAAFAARLSGMLVLGGPKTTGEIAREEGVTVGLAGEMIEEVEKDGNVCRDDVGRTSIGLGSGSEVEGGVGVTGEVTWWNNVFVTYVWDGQV